LANAVVAVLALRVQIEPPGEALVDRIAGCGQREAGAGGGRVRDKELGALVVLEAGCDGLSVFAWRLAEERHDAVLFESVDECFDRVHVVRPEDYFAVVRLDEFRQQLIKLSVLCRRARFRLEDESWIAGDVRVWEHEVQRDLEACVGRIRDAIER
jgi:hypothetical protein